MDKGNGKVKCLLNLGILNILTLNTLYGCTKDKKCCGSGKDKGKNNLNIEGSNKETEEQKQQREKEEKDRKEKEEKEKREKASLDERINNAIKKLNELKTKAADINKTNDPEFIVTVNIIEEDIKKANKNTIVEFENKLDQLEKDITDKTQKLYEKQQLNAFKNDNKDKVKVLFEKITQFNSYKFYELEIKDFVNPAELDALEFKNICNFKEKLEKNEKDLKDNELAVKSKLKEDREKIIKKIKEEEEKEAKDENALTLLKEEDIIGEDVIGNCDCNNGFNKLSEHYCLIQEHLNLVFLKAEEVKGYLTKKLKNFENILNFFNKLELNSKKDEILNLINKLPDSITFKNYEAIKIINGSIVDLQTSISNGIIDKNKYYSTTFSEVTNNCKDLKLIIVNFFEIDCFEEINKFINDNKGIKDRISLNFKLDELEKIDNFYKELKKKYDDNVVKFKTAIIENIKNLKDIYIGISGVDKKYENFFDYNSFKTQIENLSKNDFINKNDTNENKLQNYTILLTSIIEKIKENIKKFVDEVKQKSDSKNSITNEDIGKIASDFSIKLPDLKLNINTGVQKYDYFYYPFCNNEGVKVENKKEDIQTCIKSGDKFFKDIDKKVEDYKKGVFNLFAESFDNINSLFNFNICKLIKDSEEYFKYIESRKIDLNQIVFDEDYFDDQKKIKFNDKEYLLYYYEDIDKDFLIGNYKFKDLVVLANNIKLIFDHNFKIFQDILEKFKKYYDIEKRGLEDVFVAKKKVKDKLKLNKELRPTYEFLDNVKDFESYIKFLNSNKVNFKEIKISELFKIEFNQIKGIEIKETGYNDAEHIEDFLNLINIDIFNSIGSVCKKIEETKKEDLLENGEFIKFIGGINDYGNDDEKIFDLYKSYYFKKGTTEKDILELQKEYFKKNVHSIFCEYKYELDYKKVGGITKVKLSSLLFKYSCLKKILDEIPDKTTK